MKERIQISINSKLLIWARESLALTKSHASERTGISVARLNQLEDGVRFPTLDEIKLLSKAYKRTIATLLLDEPPKEKPIPKDRRTIDSKNIGLFHEKSILAIRKARALAQSFVELRNELNLPIPKLPFTVSMEEDPKLVANRISGILDLSENRRISDANLVFEICVEKIETLGIAVFQLSLPEDNLRGFSITDEIIPIIGIKRGQEPIHAKMFTLFHELGHVLLMDGGLCDISGLTQIYIEKWCNAFAAEVLVPNHEFIQINSVREHKRVGDMRWTKTELIEIGQRFHVGPLVILRRALENNLTSRDFYQIKHKTWNKPQFGRSLEPKGRELHKESYQERGRTFVSMAFKAFDQNRIDLKDLSDYLGLKLSYIPQTRQLISI